MRFSPITAGLDSFCNLLSVTQTKNCNNYQKSLQSQLRSLASSGNIILIAQDIVLPQANE